MTRVDFYQIESEEPALAFTCRLVEKIYRMGLCVHIHTADAAESAALDALLWNFRADAFVPHGLYADGGKAPVKIGHADEPEDNLQVLVNLSGQVPEFFSRFERVAEVVPLNEQLREAARANYSFYRERGYPLQYHPIKTNNNAARP